MLNQIMVGMVLIVEVIIKAMLDARAKMYNHHHCFPKIRPGKIIEILVINAQASIVFTLFQ
jgi:hypothetical protein